jgi:RNA repair, ligase-Pnkp-associating, region of Hen1
MLEERVAVGMEGIIEGRTTLRCRSHKAPARIRHNGRFAMLLTITNSRVPAANLGYLLHKNPNRLQSFELSFGKAHVFYPQAGENRCTAALLLDVDPVGLVRNRRGPVTQRDQRRTRPAGASRRSICVVPQRAHRQSRLRAETHGLTGRDRHLSKQRIGLATIRHHRR